MAHRPRPAEQLDALDLLRARRAARLDGDLAEVARLHGLLTKACPAITAAYPEAAEEVAESLATGEPPRPWHGEIWNGVHYVEGAPPHPRFDGAHCPGCPPPLPTLRRPVFPS